MRLIFMAVLILFVVLACGKKETPSPAEQKTTVQEKQKAPATTENDWSTPTQIPESDYKQTMSGLKYAVIKATEGKQPVSGDRVTVHYALWLPDGKMIDSSFKHGKPFSFTLGRGEVIRGWDEGIALLHLGERAQLIVPPELGYGPQGYPGVIPPNSTLIFEVELLDIQSSQ